MAYSVSQDFKDKIKDSTVPKRIALVFSDLYFSDEDIEQNGVQISETFSTDEHLSFGACPSAVLSFGVIAKSLLSGYSFGDCAVYIGVQTSESAFTMPAGTSAYVEIGANVWTATASGVFVNGSRISSGKFISLLYDGADLYAFGSTFSLKINPSDNSFVTYTPHKFLAQKMMSAHSVAVSRTNGVISGATVWGAESVVGYEFCPMGVFEVEKPKKTVGEVVTIQDAYDHMKWFDVDATEFLSGLTYPKTLSQIYVALCNYMGVPYASSTFPYSTVSYANSPFSDTSCTCRDILSWIAERARKVAKFDRIGRLSLEWVGSAVAESLTTSDIGMDDYDCSEYHTEAVTGVLLKSTSGTSLSYGSMDNPYSIMGNPFISTITNSDLADYEAIPTYIPMALRVIEADPSIDVGDMLSVADLADAYQMLADIYGNVWAVEVGDPEFRLHAQEDGTLYAKSNNHAIGQYHREHEVLAVPADQFQIPLMERTLTYMGHCSAVYESTGERWREVDASDNVAYNANIAPVTQMDVFNRLTNGGQDQGIYIDDGKIYINAEYIRTGSITVGGTDGLSPIRLVSSYDSLVADIDGYGMNFYDSDGTTLLTEIGRLYDGGEFVAGIANRQSDSVVHSAAKVISFGTYGLTDTSQANNYFPILEVGRAYATVYTFTPIVNIWGYNANPIDPYGNGSRVNWISFGAGSMQFNDAVSKRVVLDSTGLYFYNQSGTLTKSYLAN